MNKTSDIARAVSPYLSVVTASRNDDHGGDPLIRTQIFIANFARQCEKYQLPAELIIVDWNPVPDRPGLAAMLSLPPEAAYCKARVITVPSALHCRLKYSDKLSFFQMIAKNVGIRRAKGQFILATNIDILFSDELIRFIALQRLDIGKQYRVDRYDIQSGLTREASLDEALDYAWSNPIRANRRYHPEKLVQHLYGDELFKKICIPNPEFHGKNDGVAVVQEHDVWQVRPDRSVDMYHLNTNACGDFTLLSREGWHSIRGYPEFEAFSFNIDSMGLIAAHYAGYEEVSLLPPCVCFHIEHGIGSGWTPEGEKKLFSRLRDAGILNPEWPVLAPLVEEMQTKHQSLEFNHARWGLADFDLPEQATGDTTDLPVDKLALLVAQAETHGVSAIQPAYDLDRLTLAHERSAVECEPLAHERVVLYIPDSNGGYSEKNSIAHFRSLLSAATLDFQLDQYPHQFPLRFDPCQQPGLVTITSISVFDLHSRLVLKLDGRKAKKLTIGGTATRPSRALLGISLWKQMLSRTSKSMSQPFLNVLSTGSDPQLFLPKLPAGIEFPLRLTIEMKFIPGIPMPV